MVISVSGLCCRSCTTRSTLLRNLELKWCAYFLLSIFVGLEPLALHCHRLNLNLAFAWTCRVSCHSCQEKCQNPCGSVGRSVGTRAAGKASGAGSSVCQRQRLPNVTSLLRQYDDLSRTTCYPVRMAALGKRATAATADFKSRWTVTWAVPTKSECLKMP